MEKAQCNACIKASANEAALGFKQFKAGAEKAAILIRVGIAQHDLLCRTIGRDGIAHDGVGE